MFCVDFPAPTFLIFSSEVPQLLYYSHIPTAIMSLIIGFLIYFNNRKGLTNKLLLAVTATFFLLVFLNLISWTNVDSRLITVVWLLSQLLYFALPILVLYLYYAFVYKKDAPFLAKTVGLLLVSGLSILVALGYTMSSFDLVSCELTETPLLQIYQNITFALVFVVLAASFFWKYRQLKEKEEKRSSLIFTIGTLIFLALMILTWQVAGEFDLFQFEQYGLFGMTIFMAFLGYLIVQYKAFDIKVFGAQALMIVLVFLIGAQFFFIHSTTNKILNGITFLLSLGAGYLLIRSVGEEVKRKEELQAISNSLAKANERLKELDTAKSEFISIASHQLRTPLTAIKGYLSLILEGSYGKVPTTIQDVLNKLYTVNERLTHLVEDLLNISRIEAGRIQYNFEPTHLEALGAELVDMFALTAKNKGLYLRIRLPKEPLPQMLIDPNKIKEVLQNLIDNALKYTPQGGVELTVERQGENARIIVADTGIGIKPEDKDHLFEKFVRSKETTKMVVSGAGLGLFVGKNFIEAHGGRIWAESDGPGTGSRFVIELPLENLKLRAGLPTDPASIETIKAKNIDF